MPDTTAAQAAPEAPAPVAAAAPVPEAQRNPIAPNPDAGYDGSVDPATEAASLALVRKAMGRDTPAAAPVPDAVAPKEKLDVAPVAPGAKTAQTFPTNPLGDDAKPAAPDPDDFYKRFKQLTELEKDRQSLVDKAKRADDLETLFAKAKTDPEALFSKIGWSQDAIADYVLSGKKQPVQPQVADLQGKIAELEGKLTQFGEVWQQTQQAQRIDAFKASIPKQLDASGQAFPFLAAVHETPTEQAEAIWSVISNYYSSEGKRLEVHEAASALESALSQQAERFRKALGAESKNNQPANNSAATKQAAAPVLTNATSAGSLTTPKNSDDLSDSELEALAIETLKNRKR